MHFLTNHLDSFTAPILSEKLFESTSSVHRLHMILTNEASTADLAFDPTLACWSVRYPVIFLSLLALSVFYRQVLLLNRTMLTEALFRLRGSLCLRLASTFNHRPDLNDRFLLYYIKKQ